MQYVEELKSKSRARWFLRSEEIAWQAVEVTAMPRLGWHLVSDGYLLPFHLLRMLAPDDVLWEKSVVRNGNFMGPCGRWSVADYPQIQAH